MNRKLPIMSKNSMKIARDLLDYKTCLEIVSMTGQVFTSPEICSKVEFNGRWNNHGIPRPENPIPGS